MKRVEASLIILMIVAGSGSIIMAAEHETFEPIGIGGFVDLGFTESLLSDTVTIRGGVHIPLTEEITLDLPVTYTADKDSSAVGVLDTAIQLKYYPGFGRFFCSTTLFQSVWLVGEDSPEDRYHYMTEIAFGYTLNLPYNMYIEPMVLYRDPFMTFSDTLETVQSAVPGYGNVRVCMQLGFSVTPFWDKKTAVDQ